MSTHFLRRRTCRRSLAALGTRLAERLPRARGRSVIILFILLPAGCGGGNGEGTGPAASGPAVDVPAAPLPARFIRQIAWAQRGQWLKADTHMHTKFSDGSFTVDEVADQAVRFGCDVMAITDHGDRDLQAATPEYMAAIRAARQRHPELILLAGIEWNIPPWDGREHVVVLVPPQPDEEQILAQFKARFDDYLRETHDPALAEEALRWLSQQTSAGQGAPLAIYEHPSRKRKDVTELPAEFRRLRAVSDRLVAMAGAPGHQRSSRVGDYRGPLQPVDRWDPAVAELGGAWDVLLQEGLDVWAAHAVSDFHSTGSDYWPGEFAETWLWVPERSAGGVFQALKAGSFFAAHGHIVRGAQIRVLAEGLDRPAISGETIQVPAGATVTVELEFEVPSRDFQGQPNKIDEVELVCVTNTRSVVVAQQPPAAGSPALIEELPVEPGGMVLRARGRRIVDDGPDLLFYTNPVRIVTPAETDAAVCETGGDQGGSRVDRTVPLLGRWGIAIGLGLTAVVVLLAIRSREWRQPSATRTAWFAAAAIVCGTVLMAMIAGQRILKLDGIPYNVREAFGTSHPALSLALGALAVTMSGVLPMALCRMWVVQPRRFAAWGLAYAAAGSAIVFVLLWAAVPDEALDDILGTPVLMSRLRPSEVDGANLSHGAGATLPPALVADTAERFVRFVGSFWGPLACWTLAARLTWKGQGRYPQLGILVVAIMGLIGYFTVVVFTPTDNIVELLRGGGDLVSAASAAGLFLLIGVNAAMLARAATLGGRWAPRAVAAALLVTAASLPVGWQLFVAGTAPKLEKYGDVFSARQFLLSPDRSHYLSDDVLLMRYVVVQAAATLALAAGMCVALFVRKATSLRNQGGTPHSEPTDVSK